jgi:hypothetical protein
MEKRKPKKDERGGDALVAANQLRSISDHPDHPEMQDLHVIMAVGPKMYISFNEELQLQKNPDLCPSQGFAIDSKFEQNARNTMRALRM